MRAGVAALSLLLAAAGAGQAAEVDLDQACAGPQSLPKRAPKFEDYAVPAVKVARPAAPILNTADKRAFRSQLRRAAQQGAPFAGRYRVGLWGCGAGCTTLAIIDAKTGAVTFDDEIRNISDSAYNPFDRVTFRPDSRLLMISGMPMEDERRNGLTFYEWTGERLIFLKRYRYDQVCRGN